MKIKFIALSLFVFVSCTQKTKQSTTESLIGVSHSANMDIVKPLRLTIIESSAVPPNETKYELTENRLKISPKYNWQKKDSIEIQIPQEILGELSMVRIDSLKDYYVNECIMDGFSIAINLKNKTVRVTNYYQPQIGFIIETLNSAMPEKYKIYYDKKSLVKSQEGCPYIIEGYETDD